MSIPGYLSSYVAPNTAPGSGDILAIEPLSSWQNTRFDLPATLGQNAHSLHRFIHLEQGQACLRARHKVYPLEPQTIVNIPIGLEFRLDLMSDATGDMLTVSVHELPEVMRMSVARPTRLAQLFSCQATAGLQQMLRQMKDELSGTGVFRTAALRSMATLFAIAALRETEEQSSQAPVPPRSKYLTRILPLIRAHLEKRLSVRDYSDILGISPMHFNRLCRQLMHCSAHELIENIRFQEACRLLTHSDQSIAEIGYKLGFDDPSYFSRAFQRNILETPSDYRRKRRDTG